MSKFIGAQASSPFLREMISYKKKQIDGAKKIIKRHTKFIKQAKAELKSRGENVND